MTTLANLPDAPADASDGELIYVRPTTGDLNAKRTFGSLWRNVLGRTAGSPRAFFGATPVTQPASGNQAAVPGAPITATAGASYTTAERDLINALKAQVNAQTVLINQMRADMVSLGLIRGS